jgi:hypothetical protein
VEPYVIRPPIMLRIYVAVFLCLWCGGVVAFASPTQGRPAIVVPGLMIGFALTLGYLLVRSSVTCHDDHLLVRNHLCTRRVARSEVEGFRIGTKGSQPLTRTVFVLLRGGTVLALDAAERLSVLGRGKAQVRSDCARCRLGSVDPDASTPRSARDHRPESRRTVLVARRCCVRKRTLTASPR